MSKKLKRSNKRNIVFHWAIWFYILILISSVMAFGLVAFFGFELDREKAIYMLGMIPAMGVVTGITILKIIKTLKKRMDKISDGINRVAKGDLELELDLKNAGEYRSIYQNFNLMVKELKNTKIEMQNFMNDFSHEFKTPITSIQGFAELLIEREVSEEESYIFGLLQMSNGISKNFVIWFAKQDAARFGRKGIRVLSVSPGNFETPMGELEKEEADSYTKYCALKRIGRVEEIAGLFAYCAGESAGYLTGVDILCDGGLVASGVNPILKK